MKGLDKFVLIGKVSKPHGIKGEVKIIPFSGDSAKLASYKVLFLSLDEKGREMREHQVVNGRDQGGDAIISLAGIDNRDLAEKVRGYKVWVARDQLPELSESEFYWQDYKGKDVFTRQGEYLGKVSNLISNGPHDLLVIKGKRGKEYMIPVCDEFVEGSDEKDGRITVSPPQGLLEINK